jgi:hypothetical protein
MICAPPAPRVNGAEKFPRIVGQKFPTSFWLSHGQIQAAYWACKASSSATASRQRCDCGDLLPTGDGSRPAFVVPADERGIAPVVQHC